MGQGNVNNGSSGNISANLPSYQTGDLLLCLVESHDNVAHSISSGWNTLYSLSSGTAGGHRASLFWRIAANTSISNPTITHSGGNSIISRCVAYRGVDQTMPFDVPFSSAMSASDTTIESGSVNPVTNGAWVVFANHMADDPGQLNMTTTGGLTWTRRFFSVTSSGNDSGLGLFDTGPRQPGAVGPVVATTNTSAESTGALLVLRPAGGNVLTINKPVGVLADDIMIASISVGLNGIVVTPPSGWILVRQVVRSGTNSSTLQTYYRVATGSDPASYSWTFSGGTHVGAVGGITAFSGADLVTPIANEAGAATNSATTHTAPSVITSKANSMLVTVHEYSSSGTWTPPGGMTEAVDIASRPVPDAAGLAMEMNYELRPAFGATGTRQATANGNADLGATQSLAINPSGGLSCFGDGFDRANGAPGTDWLVGNVGGTFGNPAIVNNRLRLTNNSAQVSTYATLQRLFPAAGNKIVIEFMQYSYAGTGADGMGIVLSDAAESPIAGAFGGSLGYAPKQTSLGGDTTHEGFSGGWLGVALDEFGNYSSNTEGRSGGSAPGFTPDSVAIRGSGSGFTGYSYLRGTGTLPVGIDNAASATAAPGHKYRIIVDHSDGVHGWTSVERDTTGTGNSYGFVVPVFDAKAEPGQAAVPTNWSLSYTGATGGSGNIHEIDSLQVCSITQQVLTLHHIQLEYPGKMCRSGGVTVKACADAACTALYTGSVTVNLVVNKTSGSGTLSFLSNSVTFTGGQTTTTLSNSNNNNATASIAGTSATSPSAGNATTCLSDTGATNCSVSFVSACFDAVETSTNTPATPIYTKLANTSFNLRILAIRNSAIDTSNNGSVTVTLVDPTIAGNCDGTAAGLVTSQTINLTNGIGTVNGINYANAAKNVKARMTSGGISTCSTDNFAIRPQRFNLSTDAGTPGPYAAGTDFHITATSVTGYDGTPTLNLAQVTATPGSTNIPLSGDFSAASGITSQGTFQYDDVGTLDFNIAPTDFTAVFDPDFTAVDQVTGVVNGVNHGTSPDCLNGSATNAASGGRYGCTIGSSTLSAGRFRPDHYDVTATLTAACENKFTYMGQPALGVAIGLQAMSANGTQLARFGTGYSHLSTFTIAGDNAGVAISPLNNRLTPGLPAFAWTAGAYIVNLANYSFGRNTAPDGSYENFALKATITDSDGVNITSLNGASVSVTSGLSNTTALRFGRLKLANVNGSELMNASLQATAEYWKNGTGFVTNTDDNCTVIDASAIKLQNQLLGLNASNMPANNFIASPLSFAAGQSSITVKKPLPTPTAKGSVDVCIDLASDNTPGTVCAATSANMPWLQGKWNGTLYDDDPGARATLGIFRSGPVVYLREIY
ncbi:DUF6701 domain-containing protein [Herminiimonas sp. NPDC097707]|uniref:DUF6701 domain-containing protein n=1 Tax=Herminiimonas sp. NPDC097707 TaxID=3364007 RepID=UPI00383B05C2